MRFVDGPQVVGVQEVAPGAVVPDARPGDLDLALTRVTACPQ